MRELFFKTCDVILLVYSLVSTESFREVQSMYAAALRIREQKPNDRLNVPVFGTPICFLAFSFCLPSQLLATSWT